MAQRSRGLGGGFRGYTLRRAGPGALQTVTVGAVVPLQPRLGDGLISDPSVGTGQLPTAKPLSHVPHRSTLPLPHTEGHCSDKGELGRGPSAPPPPKTLVHGGFGSLSGVAPDVKQEAAPGLDWICCWAGRAPGGAPAERGYW